MRQTLAVCSFLPPHILRKIAENGGADLRDRAYATLEQSAELRGERSILSALPAVAVPAGEKRRTSKSDAGHEASDGARQTYDFFREVYDRNSIDDRGLRLDATLHYGADFDNALWNGRQMVYGDGDGELFNRFSKCVDVVGHELTHGLTQYTANLAYAGESGALNESFSDVFGILIKQHSLKQTAAKSDWLIGAGLFTSRIHGDAVRSMKAPGSAYDDKLIGKDPQPGQMRDYDRTTADNGGVHINSGIPNHAFYTLATLLGGKAWEVAGRIWYAALTHKLKSRAQFRDCANATFVAAGELFGAGSAPQRAVIEAWNTVGVPIGAAVVQEGPRIQMRDFLPPAGAAELPQLVVPRKAPRASK